MKRLRLLAVFLLVAVVIWSAVTRWLVWRFGMGIWPVPQGTPWTYQLESGFVPALTVLSLLGSAIALYRSVNCQVERCPRIGRYHVAGGQHRVCRAHHPDDAVRARKLTHAHITRLHREHQDRQAGTQ